jgi:hypothetical protein
LNQPHQWIGAVSAVCLGAEAVQCGGLCGGGNRCRNT